MSREHEFISETFHVLAQPITALRTTIELGLSKELNEDTSRNILESCLGLMDRLMQDLAIFRELSSLDDAPPLDARDANAVLESCVNEMKVVAEAMHVRLTICADSSTIQCNEPSLRRSMFVLLDSVIAAATPGTEISVNLRRCENGMLLQVRPGMLHGQRQKLCTKLLQFAGGNDIRLEQRQASITFRESPYRQHLAIPFPDKQVLTLQ